MPKVYPKPGNGRVKVSDLKVGDKLAASGAVVVTAPTRGVSTPAGKLDLWVRDYDGGTRHVCWNAGTVVKLVNSNGG